MFLVTFVQFQLGIVENVSKTPTYYISQQSIQLLSIFHKRTSGLTGRHGEANKHVSARRPIHSDLARN
jgi:hypothetical protein